LNLQLKDCALGTTSTSSAVANEKAVKAHPEQLKDITEEKKDSKVVSLMCQLPITPQKSPGTHFC
jgi:hypothetical protein